MGCKPIFTDEQVESQVSFELHPWGSVFAVKNGRALTSLGLVTDFTDREPEAHRGRETAPQGPEGGATLAGDPAASPLVALRLARVSG